MGLTSSGRRASIVAMSPDTTPPVLPTVDKRGKRRHLAAVPDLARPEAASEVRTTPYVDQLPELPPLAGNYDAESNAELARRVSTIPFADEVHRLADVARSMPKVLTVHEVYGQPPGDLAYTAIADWTPEQAQRAEAWLANERSKDWWRGQAAAERELAAQQ